MRYELAARQRTTEIWQGDYQMTLVNDERSVCDIGMKHPDMGEYVQLEPWMVAFRPFEPAGGKFTLHRAELALAPDVHVVDGHKCLTVRQDFNVGYSSIQTREFWVDPAMDYLPVRILTICRGALDCATDVKCTRDPVIGWMPVSWVISCFAGALPGGVTRGWSGKLTEYSTNKEIPDSTFAMPDLAPRTWVNDHRTNEHYLIRADGTKRPVGPNEFNGSNLDQLLNSDPPSSLPHLPPRRMWLIYVNIAAVLVLAAIIAARWMWQRKSMA